MFGSLYLMLVLGLLNLAFGVTALAAGQPFAIWYPGVLCGSVLSTVAGPLLPVIKRRYREVEQRQMEAEDFRRA